MNDDANALWGAFISQNPDLAGEASSGDSAKDILACPRFAE